MAKENKDKLSVGEQLQRMTKEELLTMIKILSPFSMQIRQRHINDAKARVLRRKAEHALWKYKQIDLPFPGKNAGHRAWSEFHKQAAIKSALWNQYERYWKKADKVEFWEE